MLKMRTITVHSATLPTQLPAYQSKCWQRSYPQCISQWLAQITRTYGSWEVQFTLTTVTRPQSDLGLAICPPPTGGYGGLSSGSAHIDRRNVRKDSGSADSARKKYGSKTMAVKTAALSSVHKTQAGVRQIID